MQVVQKDKEGFERETRMKKQMLCPSSDSNTGSRHYITTVSLLVEALKRTETGVTYVTRFTAKPLGRYEAELNLDE